MPTPGRAAPLGRSACHSAPPWGGWRVRRDHSLGVMPGIVRSIDGPRSWKMYPSRQVAEGFSQRFRPETGRRGRRADSAHGALRRGLPAALRWVCRDKVISGRPGSGDPETFNGQYHHQGLRSALTGFPKMRMACVLPSSRPLMSSTPCALREHGLAGTSSILSNLPTWMYNRVNVLYYSWDVSLAVPQGRRQADHQGRDPRASARGVHSR